MGDKIVDVFCSLPLRDCGRSLPSSVLDDWERLIGQCLPPDYRQFLEFFNGGKFYPRFFGYVYPFNYSGELSIGWQRELGIFELYGLNEPWDWRDLESSRDIHTSRIPADSIPIASAANDLILLDFARDGEVALWSRDCEAEVEPEDNRVPLAISFLDFAKGIRRAPRKERLQRITAVEEPFVSIQLHDLDGLQDWIADGDLSDLPDEGRSLLREACLPGAFFEGVDWLLREGVDPTGSLEAGVRTPIQLADHAGCGDIVVLLLEFGANPEHLFRDQHKPQQYILDFVKQWQAGERRSRRLP